MEKYYSFQNNDINTKISIVLSKIVDEKIYSYIMKELFTYEIGKQLKFINNLNILPKLNETQLQQNFKNNIRKIISKIKYFIQNPNSDVYKVLSCIYGAFLGDAIGAFCEFKEPNKNNFRDIFKLTSTVIGEMALSLAYAIMDNPMKDQLIPDFLYFYYGAWFNTQPLDYGKTTKNALELFDFVNFNPNFYQFYKIENEILSKNKKSLSNGFLMRKSTFIVWLYYRFYNEINFTFSSGDNYSLLNLYKKIKNLSSPDNNGKDSYYIINNIVKLCKDSNFRNIGKDEKAISETTLYYIDLFNSKKIDFWRMFGDLSSQDNVFNNMGYYLHSFKLTLYFLCNFNNLSQYDKFRTIMNQICDLGGDTDTNCCIVGAVIGPLIGVSNFGPELNRMLELIPTNRSIYSVAMVLLFVFYLYKSNIDNNLIQDNRYFLRQILTMLYGDISTNLF